MHSLVNNITKPLEKSNDENLPIFFTKEILQWEYNGKPWNTPKLLKNVLFLQKVDGFQKFL